MIKFAPHITIYDFDEVSAVQNEVIWTFSKNLKGISTVRNRFNIHVVKSENEQGVSLAGSIKSVWKYFSLEVFKNASLNEQKLLLLNLISDCFLDVAQEVGWDEHKIITARNDSIDQNIKFHYSSKVFKNKSRNIRAVVLLQIEKDRVSVWIEFSIDKKQKVIRKHLIDTHEDQFSIFRTFNKPRWFDKSNFGFEIADGLTLSISPEANVSEWNDSTSKKAAYIKYLVVYNANRSQAEMAKLANW
jgi:hypothetical protein